MARRSTGGMIGSKHEIPAEHRFGTAEEISGRDKVAHQNSPTAFKQIGPEDNGSLNLAHPRAQDRAKTFKFSGGNV